MRTSADRGPGDRSAVVANLCEEFADLASQSVVETEVRVAEAELDGQVPKGAVGELLHRLVACRLQQRARKPM